MKTISFTDFCKKASGFIVEVEHGETLIILRRGKPVAKMIPVSDKIPSWKKPGLRMKLDGSDLSSAVLDDRAQVKNEEWR